MDKYLVKGGKRLYGTVEAGGNKNSALPCIAASLLADEPVVLHRVPEIEDVSVMFQLVRSLGAQVKHIGPGSWSIHRSAVGTHIEKHLADAIRASILLAAPVLALEQYVELPPPGGDVIGHRRLDTHFLVFESFGGEAQILESGNIAVEMREHLPSDVFLDEASVTATENALMLAASADGKSTIRNAAAEPHVQDLCMMLSAMGADISGIGSNLLIVEGLKHLRGCEFTLGADYMEVGSFIGLTASTGGRVTVSGTDRTHLRILRQGFRKLEIDWTDSESSITVVCEKPRSTVPGIGGHIPKIDDAPWPGFPSDLLSIAAVAATQTDGTILIHEKMFESRLFFMDTLIRMGARIILCDPHRAVVSGPSRLHGQVMTSPDVRAGMALVIAALAAEGESEIQNIYQIERGYESLCGKLQQIGADIQRI